MDRDKQRLIEILESRANDPRVAEVRAKYFEAMDLPAGARVADIGCGSGVVARALARWEGFSGSAVGIDSDPALLEAARDFAQKEGVADRIEFKIGDAHDLEFDNASLDGITAQTSLSHMHDPLKVLNETARVLKPDAPIAIFDGDYESRAFSIGDHDLARRVESAWRQMPGHSPRITRDLPRLLQSTGFAVSEVLPFVEFQVGDAGSWLGTVERVIPSMLEAGSLTEDEATRWVESMKEEAERGTFFTAVNYYAFVARKR